MPDYSHPSSDPDDEGTMFTKNVNYKTGYSNFPNIELLTSDGCGNDANTTGNSNKEAAATNNELIESSQAYQDSGISKNHAPFDVITKCFHEEEYIRDRNEVLLFDKISWPMDLAKVKQLHLLIMPESKPDFEMIRFRLMEAASKLMNKAGPRSSQDGVCLMITAV